jgi:lysine 2,3-aminomutase
MNEPESWQQELRSCIRTLEQLERFIPLSNKPLLAQTLKEMRFSITPHTLTLIDWSNPRDPLLLMCVPHERELIVSPEELRDPIGDEDRSPIPFLTHRYPDRALIYTTFFCSLSCRFCFRRFKTGSANPGPTPAEIDRICAYLHTHPEIEEIILTGGDPLTLVDRQLEMWLKKLRIITSIQRIRIHTRVPVNLPSRITDTLTQLLHSYTDSTHPVYVVTHFNHAREIASENIAAIAKLVDAGIVVRNQSVLLKGVNDDAETLTHLFKTLTNIRVVPYYLHQLDLARGTNHFRVPMKRGIALMRELQGRVTGIALPRYMLDLPQGKGKVPLSYPYVTQEHDEYRIESPFGERVTYREPCTLSDD